MRTLKKLLYGELILAIGFVTLAFVALFFFIDFVQQLGAIGRGRYGITEAALYCLLSLPGHFYELIPITVLIGSIYALANLAQSSEYTILRTGGLGPGRALQLLLQLGLAFTVLTYVVGDHLAPRTEAWAQRLQSLQGSSFQNATAWLRDRIETPQGERHYTVKVGDTQDGRKLNDVRIYEFDHQGRLLSSVEAQTATVGDDGVWEMQMVKRQVWPQHAPAADSSATDTEPAMHVEHDNTPHWSWSSNIRPEVVTAATLTLSSMSTLELARYITHLDDNAQSAQNYEIQFWRRALYPFACLVMLALALPFAYLHGRSGGISVKVFGGIMLGISFVLLNNVAGHLAIIHHWIPWLSAAVPSLLYLLLSLGAFAWLVRYR